jgi:hypothetical protein
VTKVRCAHRWDGAPAFKDLLLPKRSTLLAVDIFAERQGARRNPRRTPLHGEVKTDLDSFSYARQAFDTLTH